MYFLRHCPRLFRLFVFFISRFGPLPGREGLVVAAQFLVGIAQMVQDRGIGLLFGDRFFQLGNGLGQTPETIVDPAQAIAIGAVFRLGGNGGHDHLQGPVEVLVFVGPEKAKIVIGPHVVGILVQHLLEELFGLVEPAQGHADADIDDLASRRTASVSTESFSLPNRAKSFS